MTHEVRVGLIDSGCTPAQLERLAAARRFWLEDGELRSGEVLPDRLGHGTALLDILQAQVAGAEVLIAQVFTERWAATPLQVAAALDWLVAQGVQLVNLSLGLRHDRPALREACGRALDAGVLLCASSPARGEPVFPASYPGVIRVSGDARCAAGQWSWLDSPQADFGAHVVAPCGMAGASVACAALSGLIGAFLQDHPEADREAVLTHLRRGAAFIGPERKGVSHG